MAENTIFDASTESRNVSPFFPSVCSWVCSLLPFLSFTAIYWNETQGEIYQPLVLPANIFIYSRVAARKHQRTSLLKETTLYVNNTSYSWCVISGNLLQRYQNCGYTASYSRSLLLSLSSSPHIINIDTFRDRKLWSPGRQPRPENLHWRLINWWRFFFPPDLTILYSVTWSRRRNDEAHPRTFTMNLTGKQ